MSDPTVRNAEAMAPVIQADRGRAARLLVEQWTKKHGGFHSWMTASTAPILIGAEDACPEVQAFARHRIAALSPADGATGAEMAHENDAPEARLDMVRVVLEAIAKGEEPRALARAGLDFCNLTQAERETMRGEGAALTPTETGEQG